MSSDSHKVIPLTQYREHLKEQLASLKLERELLYDALEEANRIISAIHDTALTQKYRRAISNLDSFRQAFISSEILTKNVTPEIHKNPDIPKT
jgi:hypothetical protein